MCRALSKLGVLSRTQAMVAIAAGRVTVAGDIVRDPGFRIALDLAVVAIDGVRVERQRWRYVAMHKPTGVVTTRSDERGRRTVYDLLPRDLPLLSPVGRLDQNSSGLLLFTNDSQLGNAISGPASTLAKAYEVDLDAPLSERDVARMTGGMSIDGTPLLPIEVHFPTAQDRSRAVLTLREGKNRQIRRMAKACGREVVRLHRTAIGPLRLLDMAVGGVRELPAAELATLRAAVGSRLPR